MGKPRSAAHLYTHLEVGRNKPVRALAQDRRFRHPEGLGVPETPTLAVAGRAYSGLHPGIYVDTYALPGDSQSLTIPGIIESLPICEPPKIQKIEETNDESTREFKTYKIGM